MGYGLDDFETKLEILRGKRKAVNAAYEVFLSSGQDQIITRKMLKDETRVKDLLVLSQDMESFLDEIIRDVKNFSVQSSNGALVYFYYSQFGGSKSQFRALLHVQVSPVPL